MGIDGRALYQLAKKYRPANFSKIMGQEHIDFFISKGYKVELTKSEVWVKRFRCLSTDFNRLEMLYWIPVELIPTIQDSWYWTPCERDLMLYRLEHYKQGETV